MTKFFNRLIFAGVIFLMAVSLVSCGGGGSSGGSGGTTGTLNIGLTDDPGDYQNVFVTIKEIRVHQAAGEAADDDPGWITILTPEETYDLLELVNGTIQYLGATELEAGHYTQMRLILMEDDELPYGWPNLHANYLVDNEGTEIPLTVPSGPQTGIKLVNGFDITAGNTTELILDFDADKSIVKAGDSGQWHLKPTIKVVDTVNNSLEGIVTDDGDSLPEVGVSVSAQQAAAVVSSATSQIDDGISGDGFYYMFLPAETFNVVAFKEGFHPACIEIDAFPVGAHVQDFLLSPAVETGTITGSVTADSADFSIRQTINCGSGDVEVELASFSLGVAGSQAVTLPASTGGVSYHVVVSGDDGFEEFIDLTTGATEEVIYPPPAP